MTKRTYWYVQIILTIYFIVYMSATMGLSTFWVDILSPLGILLALIISIFTAVRSEIRRIIWIPGSFACLFYVVADLTWSYYELVAGINPENLTIVNALYLLPNILFAVCAGAFFISQKNRWDNFQIGIDILAISSTLLTVIWLIFLNRYFEMLMQINVYSIWIFIYLLCLMFISACIVILYAFMERDKFQVSDKLLLTAGAVYVCSGFYYTYLLLYDLYVPNSLIDAAAIFSVLLFAQAGLWEMYKPKTVPPPQNEVVSETFGSNRKGFILLAAPIIVTIVNGFALIPILLLIAIFVVHKVLSKYVQLSIKNAQLLLQQKQINTLLEERIEERTQELVNANRDLDLLATKDSTTTLFNRRHFLISLEKMLHEEDSSEPVYVLYIDLDRFKAINDAYGHDIGDQVLVEIAGRLEQFNKYNALIARQGGDEFVIALRGPYTFNDIHRMAQDIIKICCQLIFIPPFKFQISVSIGITQYPLDARDCNELMRNADIAMYHAKSQGFNKYVFYSTLGKKIRRRNKLELQLKNANYDAEFELFYQPLVHISDRKLIGMEALLRWNNLTLGAVSPDEFIPIAEESGLIVPLGRWVIREAVHQIARWNTTYNTDLKVGINISPQQLNTIDFIDYLQEIMQQYAVPPAWLDIEITENVAMKGQNDIEKIFTLLSRIGISISIDDFGTGYSSLSYLKNYPIDCLKIARQLVVNITTSFNDVQIVKAIIMIGKAMGISTIAEGVEYEDQLQLLAELGCDKVQGYLFSRPIPASQFEQTFLQQSASHSTPHPPYTQ